MTIRFLLLLSFSITGCAAVEPPDDRQVPAAQRASPSSAQNSDASLAEATIVRGNGFVGVIFPANTKAIQGLYPKDVAYWTPSEADILVAEKGLVPFLKSLKDPKVPEIVKRIETYKRQYRGIIIGGKKEISIRFLCETFSDDWTREEMIISDGGLCFFNLRFLTETKTFSQLQINGYA